MAYTFDFSSIWEYREYLVNGVLGTIRLTLIGTLLGISVGILGAVSRAWKLPGLAQLFTGYVELLVVLSDGAAARRLLVHVSRATRAELERSFRDGLRRAGADL